ncbi:unnamed protein product [Lymnaea stagnalis]|uniref:Uncharacterized protein n=1 Tax=Lymnaea stagnalis TaxID=6523 RepID=A0AAV2HZG7_LYMST
MRVAVCLVTALCVWAYTGVQGSPTNDGLIAKRDDLQQETAGEDLLKKGIDEQVVSTVERAVDTLNELFQKRPSPQQRRTLIDDRYNKDDVLKKGLAIPDEKRGDTDPGQRSNLEQQLERLKRASRKNRALLTLVRRGWWSDTWDTVKDAAGSVGDRIKDGYNTLKDKIEDKVDVVKEKWQKFKEVFERKAVQAPLQFSDIVNYVDKRDSGHQDD